VLDVGGIGFDIITPDHASTDLTTKGKEILLWTHLQLREDSLNIYGFERRQERELFRLLITVSGVGPRLAIQILSSIQPEELVRVMADEDWKRLTLIPGIGPKTARRLLIQLKEKLTDEELQFLPSSMTPKDPVLAQAYNALQNLGFPTESIRIALKDISTTDELEEVIKKALTKLAP